MIKLIAIDTDGTLLNSQGEIQASTKEAISKALDRGVKIVLCSGRQIAVLTPASLNCSIPRSTRARVSKNSAAGWKSRQKKSWRSATRETT